MDVARYVMREELRITYEGGEKAESAKEAVSLFVEEIVGQFPLISIAINSKLRGEIEMLLVKEMKEYFGFILSHMEHGRGLDLEEIEFHADFIACGMVLYTIEHCNEAGFDPDGFKEELWRFLSRIYSE